MEAKDMPGAFDAISRALLNQNKVCDRLEGQLDDAHKQIRELTQENEVLRERFRRLINEEKME